MVNCRRATIPDATYFFTVTLRDRGSRLLIDQITAFREALQTTGRSRPFRIDALARAARSRSRHPDPAAERS
jgi:putative transposase